VVLSPLATIPSVLVVPPATSAVPVRHATTGPHFGLYFVRSKPCLPPPSRVQFIIIVWDIYSNIISVTPLI
ncbi:hypothetical protein B0H13DRAFT_1962123, partial [Mycena leptocephala]